LAVAEAALKANPEDIPLGRTAEEIILKFRDDPVSFFKARTEKSESIAAHYLYGDICGRANADTVIGEREAAWILKKDSTNFWGHLLAGDAAWNYSKPDLARVQKEYEAAIAADPSRTEGYESLGFLFEDSEKWPEARAAFDAGGVTDPISTIIREHRLTCYAEMRDASAYFDLVKGAYSDQPLTADLSFASKPGKLTSADLTGQATVIEYWAFT
jgi:hypothetical protein